MAKVKGKMIRPFGPTIGKFTLPKKIIDDFNNVCDLVSQDEGLSRALDHSQRLVGKVKQELSIPDEIIKQHQPYFNGVVSDYLKQINKQPAGIESNKTGQGLIPPGASVLSQVKSAWIVRSFAGDYNPVHMHPDAVISCAGFLKVPDWSEELSEDKKDHYGLTHGCLSFLFGDLSALSQASHIVRPKVGDFYMFPGWLQHTVYPFKSEGERRSFSLNIIPQFVSKSQLK